MQANLTRILVPGGIGAVVALAGSTIIAITSAIAAPAWFFDPFRAHSLLPLGLLTWDVLVTYGIALVVPSTALLIAAYRFLIAPSLLASGAYLIAALLVVYIGYPAIFGEPSLLSLSRRWWSYGLEISLVLSAVLSWAISNLWRPQVVGLAQP